MIGASDADCRASTLRSEVVQTFGTNAADTTTNE